MINIFIVEDQSNAQDGIKSIVEKEPGFKVIGEAKNDEEAINKLSEAGGANVVLTSVNQIDQDTISLLEGIKERYPENKLICLTSLEDQKYISKAFKAGVSGYLLKTISQDEMIFAVKHIAAGEKYICSELSIKLVQHLIHAPYSSNLQVELSRRESEVLGLIAEGFTNNEIANKLFTSRRTVEGHRQNLLDKTNTRNTAALIRFAVKNGLV
ncbi:LuxR C-terminal-related transcriptional regulator [Desertivirga arenae]|uniref:LuxR C-terminal-related transcriptional regulator n=1 Tax=Desertivirga arenae TaxID=2810309 RepID=UPI001A973AF4|nr:response regulator transcription factor [Pedobacter sp. SYSU D00823]